MAQTRRIEYNAGFNVDRSGLVEVQRLLRNIQADANINMSEELKQATKAAGTLNTALRKAFNQDTGKIDLTRFHRQLRESGTDLNTLRNQLSRFGVEGQVALSKLNNELKLNGQYVRESSEVFKQLKQTLLNSVQWNMASAAIDGFSNSIHSAIGYVKQLNASLRDIQVVSGYSNEYMREFAENANKAAKEIGLTTLDFTEAALIYIQQGKREDVVNQLSDITLRASQVVGTSTKDMSEYLTAVWNGFRISAEEAEATVDKLAAVAANSGANLEELATAMGKVASVANTLGMTTDQLNAAIATIVTVTRQAPENVGVAMKTILARLEEVKLGETLDDGVTLGKVASQLDIIGVKILDEQGELREIGTIIEEVGNKWNTLTKAQQNALAIVMAGKYQYNALLSLFDNWDMYLNVLDVSSNSLGELQKQHEIYLESIAAYEHQLTAELQALYSNVVDEDAIIGTTKALTKFIEILNGVVTGMGGIQQILPLLISGLTIAFSGKIAAGLYDKIGQINTRFKDLVSHVREVRDEMSGVDVDARFEQELEDRWGATRRQNEEDYASGEIDLGTYNHRNALIEQSIERERTLHNLQREERGLLSAASEAQKQSLQNYDRQITSLQAKLRYHQQIRSALTEEANQNERLIAQNQNPAFRSSLDTIDSKLNNPEGILGNIENEQYMQSFISMVRQQKDLGVENLEILRQQVNEWALQSGASQELTGDLNTILDQSSSIEEVLQRAREVSGENRDIIQQQREELIQLVNNEENLTREERELLIQRIRSNTELNESELAERNISEQLRQQIAARQRQLEQLRQQQRIQRAVKIATVAATGLMELSMAMQTFGDAEATAEDKANALFHGVTNGINAAAFAIHPLAGMITTLVTSIGGAIFKNSKAFDALIEKLKSSKEKVKELTDEVQNLGGEIDSLTSELEEVNEQLERFNDLRRIKESGGSLTAEERKELDLLTKQADTLQLQKKYLEQKIELQKQSARASFNEAKNQQYSFDQIYYNKGSNSQFETFASPEFKGTAIEVAQQITAFAQEINQLEQDAAKQITSGKAFKDMNLTAQNVIRDYAKTLEGESKKIVDEFVKGKVGFEDSQELQVLLKEIDPSKFGQFELVREKINAISSDIKTGLEQQADAAAIIDINGKEYADILTTIVNMNDALSGQAEIVSELASNSLSKLQSALYPVRNITEIEEEDIEKLRNLSNAWNMLQEGVERENVLKYLKDNGIEVSDSLADLDKNIMSLAGTLSNEFYQSLVKMAAQGKIDIETFEKLGNVIEHLTNVSGTSEAATSVDTIVEAYQNFLEADSDAKRNQIGSQFEDWYMVANASKDAQLTFFRQMYEEQRKIQQFAQYQSLQDMRENLETLMKEADDLRIKYNEASIKGNHELAQSFSEQYDTIYKQVSELTEQITNKYNEFMENTTVTYKTYQDAIEGIYNEGEGLLSNDEAWLYLKDLPDYEEYFYKGSYEILRALINQQDEVNMTIAQRIAANKKELAETEKILAATEKRWATMGFDNKQIQEFKDKIDRLKKEIEEDEINLNVNLNLEQDVDNIVKLSSELDNLYNMLHEKEDTGSWFNVTTEELKQIMNVFPELLAEHSRFVDGVIQLNRAGVDAFIAGKDAEVKADAQSKIDMIDNMITIVDAEIDTLESMLKSHTLTWDAINHAREIATNYELQLQTQVQGAMIDTENVAANVATNIGLNFDNASAKMAQSLARGSSSGLKNLNQLGLMARNVAMQIQNIDNPLFKTGSTNTGSTYAKVGKISAKKTSGTSTQIAKTAPGLTNGKINKTLAIEAPTISDIDKAAGIEIDRLTSLKGALIAYKGIIGNSFSGVGRKDGLSGGSGKKGSSSKEKELEGLEHEENIYHFINQELERQESLLKDVQKIKDTLYGEQYLESLEDEKTLLEAINELSKTKYGMQIGDLQAQQKYLSEEYGAEFDENGLLTNYNTLLMAQAQKVSELAEAKNEEEHEKAKERYDEMEDALDNYLSTLKDSYSLEQEIIDMQVQIMENNLDAIVKKIEFDLQPTKDTVSYLDFLNKFYANDYYQSGENLTRLNEKYLETADTLDIYKDGIEELKKSLLDGEISLADFNEEVRKQRDTLQESLLTLSEIEEEMRNAYKKALDEASDEIEDHAETLDHYNNMMGHFINLMDLIGEGHEYGALSDIYGSQSQNYMEQLHVQQEWYKNLLAQKELLKDTGQEGTDAWKEVINALEDVEDQVYSLAENALEALKDSYLSLIDDVTNKLDKSLTGGSKIQNMLTQYERDRDLGSMYLDKPTQLYEIDALQKDIAKTMEETTDKLQKEKLSGLYEELEIMRKQDKISEYDMERMRAKFELLQAQAALEDAQNNKNVRRLTRTSQGTWEHTFTADKQDVEEASNEVADAYNNLYQMSKEHMQDLEQQILDTVSQYENELAQLYKDWADGKFESEEEFFERRDALTNFYETKITELTAQYNKVRADNALDAEDLILSTSKETGDALIEQIEQNKNQFNEAVADMADKIGGDGDESFKTITDNAIKDLDNAWKDYNNNIKDIQDDVGFSLGQMQEQTKDLEDQSRDLANTISREIIPALQDEINQVIRATAAHREEANALREKIQAYLEYLRVLNTQINSSPYNGDKKEPETGSTGSSIADIDWAREALVAAAAGNRQEMMKAIANRIQKLEDAGMDYSPTKEYAYFNSVFDQIEKGNKELQDAIKDLYDSGKGYTNETANLLNALFKQFDTGGYTRDGGLAVLHEKEIVLNQNDTQNMLDLVSITRNLMNSLSGYAGRQFDFGNLGSFDFSKGELLQNIQIEASFPGVSSHQEIEIALLNLATDASQYVNRKR